MFKLSNANGKFDIVFSEGLHTEENAVLGAVVSTSASRRKYKEAKSKVIPKNIKSQPINKHLKTNKASELRKANLSQDLPINDKETLNNETSTKKSPAVKSKKVYKNGHNTVYEEKTKNLKNRNNKKKPFLNKLDEVVNEKVSGNPDDKSSFITKNKLDLIYTQFIQTPKDLNEVQSNGTLIKSTTYDGTEIISQKAKEIHKPPVVMDTEYNPWGKPGGGAPLKNGYGRLEKKISKNNNEYIKTKDSMNSDSSSLNAISDNKNEILSEAEKQKHKLLEHQKAVEKQVEEKLMFKKMEQERRQQEDQKAEIRFLREQEMLKMRQEAEETKQRLKEAEMRKRQEQLVESIRLAEEAAKLQRVKTKKEKKKSQEKQLYESGIMINAAEEDDTIDNVNDSLKIIDKKVKSYNKDFFEVESSCLKPNHNLHVADDSIDFNTNMDLKLLSKNKNVEKESMNSINIEENVLEKNFTSESTKHENDLFENKLESFPSIFLSVFENQNNSFIQNKNSLLELNSKKQGVGELFGRYSDHQDSPVVQHQSIPLSNPSTARKDEILNQLQLLREGLLKKQLQYYDNLIT
ncbi:DNA ligase 1-like isoform X3 [Hydra vulgaris]|uniref:DNA ligase 1-like isoform X3 n=1 Tax=Hydra vulgaris TaxID=6087 RepID=A0ABM4D460_HYDVU